MAKRARRSVEEQIDRATTALHRFHERRPLYPVHDTVIDLAGFGEAPVRFAAFGDDSGDATGQYLLLSEVAEPFGVPLGKAHAWARGITSTPSEPGARSTRNAATAASAGRL